MVKKIALGIIFITLLSFTVSNNFRDLILEKLDDYVENYPEKIYIQTDKAYYALGDDLWFTTYLVNGVTHKKSEKSNIIYLELIDSKDSIISQKQLYINDLSTSGDFKIDKNWQPGNYILRAYTHYMKNWDSDYFFKKEIPIFDISENNTQNKNNSNVNKNSYSEDITSSAIRPDLNLYPEGGYLVEGIVSKVAIKIKNYENLSLEGYIKDSNNEIIITFKTFKFGLAHTVIKPEPNKSYYASIFIDGKEEKYDLPKALQHGYSLNITNNSGEIIVKTTSNMPLALKNTFLMVHQRGETVFETFQTEAKNTSICKLNTTNLPNGILHFTLFNPDGLPVCERLAFVNNPNKEVEINISNISKNIKTREKVTLEIDLKDKQGNFVAGNLSLSITDLDLMEENSNNENIKTYLLLNSDLRGHIEDPGYFFEKENDPQRNYLLDLTLLTHGWTRFTWNDLLYNNTEKNRRFNTEKGIYVSGFTNTLKTRQQITAATRLSFMTNNIFQDLQQSGKNGKFSYGPYVFYDSIPVIIEARLYDFENKSENNRDVSILLSNNTYKAPKIERKTILKNNIDDSTRLKSFINKSRKISELNDLYIENARLLDEIVIVAKKKTAEQIRDELLNDLTNYGSQPTRRLDMNDIPNSDSYSIFELLSMIGVKLNNNSTPSFDDTDSSSNNHNTSLMNDDNNPLIILDGMRVDVETISFLTGSDIEFIDFLRGADAQMYSNSNNGVVAIYSKRGSGFKSTNIKRKPGIINFYSHGFYTAREFYSPDYSNEFDIELKQDVRTTLYWKPKITLTQNKNKAEVSFYTSDVRSRYAIKIEGITENGIPVYKLSTFDVE